MPARAEEVHHAREEGIEFRMLTNPVEFLGDEKGWLTGARCVRMELGEPDAERPPPPRRRSQAPSSSCPPMSPSSASAPPPIPLIQSTTPDLKTNKRQLHRRRSGNHAHLKARRLRRRRHRHRRRNRDPGHGRRPQSRGGSSTSILASGTWEESLQSCPHKKMGGKVALAAARPWVS